jgi:hypothetical protein
MNRRRKVDQLHYELLTSAEVRRGGSFVSVQVAESVAVAARVSEIKLIKTTTRSHNPLMSGEPAVIMIREQGKSITPADLTESEREK